MFCGYKPSAPENIEDIRQKWDKRNFNLLYYEFNTKNDRRINSSTN